MIRIGGWRGLVNTPIRNKVCRVHRSAVSREWKSVIKRSPNHIKPHSSANICGTNICKITSACKHGQIDSRYS